MTKNKENEMINERYFEYGAENREDYFQLIAEEYDVALDVVRSAALILGEDEDFDGLISTMEDLS